MKVLTKSGNKNKEVSVDKNWIGNPYFQLCDFKLSTHQINNFGISDIARTNNLITIVTSSEHGLVAGDIVRTFNCLRPEFKLVSKVNSVPTTTSLTIVSVGSDITTDDYKYVSTGALHRSVAKIIQQDFTGWTFSNSTSRVITTIQLYKLSGLPNSNHVCRFYIDTGDEPESGSCTFTYKIQESLDQLENKDCTLSFYASSDLTNKKIGLYLTYQLSNGFSLVYGTGGIILEDNPVVSKLGHKTLSSSLIRYGINITMPDREDLLREYRTRDCFNKMDLINGNVNVVFVIGCDQTTSNDYCGVNEAIPFSDDGHVEIGEVALIEGYNSYPIRSTTTFEDMLHSKQFIPKTVIENDYEVITKESDLIKSVSPALSINTLSVNPLAGEVLTLEGDGVTITEDVDNKKLTLSVSSSSSSNGVGSTIYQYQTAWGGL